jgi:very-short-patch-repair endonuclease
MRYDFFVKIIFAYNNTLMKNRRRQLRNSPTEAELMLWKVINKSQLGYRFTRQYSVGGYVLDFFCPVKRLAIEVDGSIHDGKGSKIYDEYRSKWLNGANIVVVRFRNCEIENNMKSVVEKIKFMLTAPPLKVRGGQGVLHG